VINSSQNDHRKTTKTSVHELMDFKILNCVAPATSGTPVHVERRAASE